MKNNIKCDMNFFLWLFNKQTLACYPLFRETLKWNRCIKKKDIQTDIKGQILALPLVVMLLAGNWWSNWLISFGLASKVDLQPKHKDVYVRVDVYIRYHPQRPTHISTPMHYTYIYLYITWVGYRNNTTYR